MNAQFEMIDNILLCNINYASDTTVVMFGRHSVATLLERESLISL